MGRMQLDICQTARRQSDRGKIIYNRFRSGYGTPRMDKQILRENNTGGTGIGEMATGPHGNQPFNA